jgi:hypothetical protein
MPSVMPPLETAYGGPQIALETDERGALAAANNFTPR